MSQSDTTTTIVPKTQIDRTQVWVYFKKCDDDPEKARCNLCSIVLCNKETTDILWDHIKSKHSHDQISNILPLPQAKNDNNNHNHHQNHSELTHNNNNNSNHNSNSLNVDIVNGIKPNHNHHHHSSSYRNSQDSSQRPFMTQSNKPKSNTPNHNNNIANNNNTHKNTIKKNHYNQHQPLLPSPFKNNNTKNLSQYSDCHYFIDDDDLNITSMKPLPSSSLSRNLISRLNQLSSPVTRKLKFWNRRSIDISGPDFALKVIYLGNLGMQLWSKDESCLEKPLSTLWNNYLVNMKTEIVMRLTICNSGLKAITRQHGLTQYWSNRLVYCCSHKNYPRIFSWVYRHEGKKMRQELRCHAVFCPSPEKAAKMVVLLNQRLACALQEFKREKKSRSLTPTCSSGSATLSSSSSLMLQQKLPRTIPLRRQILEKGSANFRLPLERSKSAPKLTSILEEDDDVQTSQDEFEYELVIGNGLAMLEIVE